jgi:hypothetical protein
MNLKYAYFDQQAFLPSLLDKFEVNSIWFFKPFETALKESNLTDINDIARLIGAIEPEFWKDYVFLKRKAVDLLLLSSKRMVDDCLSKYVETFVNQPITKRIIYFESFKKSDCVWGGYLEGILDGEKFSILSKQIYDLIIEDFTDLICGIDEEKFLTNQIKSVKYILRSDYVFMKNLCQKLLSWKNVIPGGNTNILETDLFDEVVHENANKIYSKFCKFYKVGCKFILPNNEFVIYDGFVLYDSSKAVRIYL